MRLCGSSSGLSAHTGLFTGVSRAAVIRSATSCYQKEPATLGRLREELVRTITLYKIKADLTLQKLTTYLVRCFFFGFWLLSAEAFGKQGLITINL